MPQRLILEDSPALVPQVVEIVLPYRGLNSVDFSIHNTSSQPATYGLAATACRQCRQDQDCGSELELEAGNVSCDLESGVCSNHTERTPCSEPVTIEPIALEPGAVATGRLNEADLGLADLVHLEFSCLPTSSSETSRCSGTLDFILLLRQVECLTDSDCSSNEICDTLTGFCAAEVKAEEGCNTMGSRAFAPSLPVAFLATLALVMVFWQKRRPRGGKHRGLGSPPP